MKRTTVRIVHDDQVITTFVRETFDYPEYDVPWHEVPVVSDKWAETDARMRVSDELSNRGAPKGLLDRQAHHPRYCGLPYLLRPGRDPVSFLEGPTQWSWEDGKAGFSIPRDGEKLPGGDGKFGIKYTFPDGGQPIWHRNVAPALDLLVDQGIIDVPLSMLRRGVAMRNTPRRTKGQ